MWFAWEDFDETPIYTHETFMNTMKALWHVERGLWIRDLGGHVFLFEFVEDKER